MKRYKGYVIGILIGASLMFSAQSFAEDGLTEIKALLRTGLNITLDGSKVELDNPSINYNGSTYIKLRDAGKLTGTGVVWNEKTQTVEMSSVGTSQDKADTVTSTAVKNEVTVSPSPLTQITPAPTPHVELPAVLKGDDAVFISTLDIYNKRSKDVQDSMLVGVKKGKIVVTFHDKQYITETNINYFYDNETDISYLSKKFLLQMFDNDFLEHFDIYSIDFTKRIPTLRE